MVDKPIYVIAAEVAAELHRSVLIANKLSLVASNARALALRAGASAAGFRPITDAIDDLVNSTLSTSKIINLQAQQLCQLAIASARSLNLLERVETVYHANQPAYCQSRLDSIKHNNQRVYQELNHRFECEYKTLYQLLQDLYEDLRIAKIISVMLSVEASQTDDKFQLQLNLIAEDVSELAQTIQGHVMLSLNIFSNR
ncbi:chemotaxis protein [Vibrio mimicus]|nr:chemotaxis protein [Vibrio mimicus]QXC58047.1 chemotaxis protein [Vibrio mimicus]